MDASRPAARVRNSRRVAGGAGGEEELDASDVARADVGAARGRAERRPRGARRAVATAPSTREEDAIGIDSVRRAEQCADERGRDRP